MNPYMPFCLYVAARVFIQLLKANARDLEISRSLNFLLAAMRWLKTKNPLSESFLIQLGLDIQGSGLDHVLQNPELTTRLKDTVSAVISCILGCHYMTCRLIRISFNVENRPDRADIQIWILV